MQSRGGRAPANQVPPATRLLTATRSKTALLQHPRAEVPVGEQINECGEVTLRDEILHGPGLTSSSGNTEKKI